MKEDKPFIRELTPGLFEINAGNMTMWTGAGGKKMLEEALQEDGRKFLASLGKVKPSKIRKKVISREEIEKTLKELWYGKD